MVWRMREIQDLCKTVLQEEQPDHDAQDAQHAWLPTEALSSKTRHGSSSKSPAISQVACDNSISVPGPTPRLFGENLGPSGRGLGLASLWRPIPVHHSRPLRDEAANGKRSAKWAPRFVLSLTLRTEFFRGINPVTGRRSPVRCSHRRGSPTVTNMVE